MIKKLLFFSFLISNHMHLYAVIAQGDPEAEQGTTFSFSVGSAFYNRDAQLLWSFSGQDMSVFSEDVQSYGISYTSFVKNDGYLQASLISYPYITTDAYITYTQDGVFSITPDLEINPLLSQNFLASGLIGSNVVVVDDFLPNNIYYIQSVRFSDGKFGKTSPEGTSIINVLSLDEDYQISALGTSVDGSLFFSNSQGSFGSTLSYISFAKASSHLIEIEGNARTTLQLVKIADQEINTTTPVVTAGTSTLSALDSDVTIFPSPIQQNQVYVGVDVTSGSGFLDRAVALFLANAQAAEGENPAAVVFSSLIPDDVAQQGVTTPISTVASNRIAVQNVTTTQTSTGFSYLVTSYFNGSDQQYIYAMPLVTMSTNADDNGKVANIDSIAQTFKIIGATYRTQGFDEVIADADQINIESVDQDVIDRLLVGIGAVPLVAGQFIKQLIAQGDAVYIVIQNPFDIDTTPGMFKSQAIFDVQGKIKSWTPWQRVVGTDDQMLFAINDQISGATMYISGATSNTIQQTTWNNDSDLNDFIVTIKNELPMSQGGVQNVFTISSETPNISNYSLAIATGNQKAIIAQTGSLNSDNQMVIDEIQNVIMLEETIGLTIGSVVAASFAYQSTTDNNWLFLGGDNGLSVLSDDETGVGFNGQLTSLDQLVTTGQSCKTLGNFKFVKKIVSFNNSIYVLTTNAVYKIVLDADKFTLDFPSALDAQIVVQGSLQGSFLYCLDMIIDQNLMILGTTNGLFTLDLNDSLPITPQQVIIPGGLSAVSRLMTVATSGVEDQGFYESSNLYVLSINFAYQQARLNRFSITNGIIQPIEDQLLEGENGPLVEFYLMKNNIFIDGSFGYATSYKIGEIPASVTYMNYYLQAGKSSTQILLKNYTTDISIHAVLNALGLARITRDYASGCLIVAGSFGLLTNS